MKPQINTKRSLLKISVTDQNTRDLMEEFHITGSHVRNCLKFYTDSQLARKVRRRAIEMMEKVVERNKELMAEYDQD